MKLHTVMAGYFKLDGGAMHGVVPKSMWHKANPADEHNMISLAMRCLLIEYDDRVILVDNGMGNKQDSKFFSYYYPHGDATLERSLAALGFTFADITDAFLTHLHFDHCGGSIRKEGDNMVPAFPNARYWSNKAHWDWAVHPNIREKASFLPENILPMQQSGQLHFIEAADGGEWLPGIHIHYADGHTEKMMLLQVNNGSNTILYCADLVPTAAHISMPWVMAYDMRPLDTLAEKEKLLNMAADNGWLLMFEHDPHIECASLERDDKGRIRMKESVRLQDL